jgi:hypothetical protein
MIDKQSLGARSVVLLLSLAVFDLPEEALQSSYTACRDAIRAEILAITIINSTIERSARVNFYQLFLHLMEAIYIVQRVTLKYAKTVPEQIEALEKYRDELVQFDGCLKQFDKQQANSHITIPLLQMIRDMTMIRLATFCHDIKRAKTAIIKWQLNLYDFEVACKINNNQDALEYLNGLNTLYCRCLCNLTKSPRYILTNESEDTLLAKCLGAEAAGLNNTILIDDDRFTALNLIELYLSKLLRIKKKLSETRLLEKLQGILICEGARNTASKEIIAATSREIMDELRLLINKIPLLEFRVKKAAANHMSSTTIKEVDFVRYLSMLIKHQWALARAECDADSLNCIEECIGISTDFKELLLLVPNNFDNVDLLFPSIELLMNAQETRVQTWIKESISPQTIFSDEDLQLSLETKLKDTKLAMTHILKMAETSGFSGPLAHLLSSYQSLFFYYHLNDLMADKKKHLTTIKTILKSQQQRHAQLLKGEKIFKDTKYCRELYNFVDKWVNIANAKSTISISNLHHELQRLISTIVQEEEFGLRSSLYCFAVLKILVLLSNSLNKLSLDNEMIDWLIHLHNYLSTHFPGLEKLIDGATRRKFQAELVSTNPKISENQRKPTHKKSPTQTKSGPKKKTAKPSPEISVNSEAETEQQESSLNDTYHHTEDPESTPTEILGEKPPSIEAKEPPQVNSAEATAADTATEKMTLSETIDRSALFPQENAVDYADLPAEQTLATTVLQKKISLLNPNAMAFNSSIDSLGTLVQAIQSVHQSTAQRTQEAIALFCQRFNARKALVDGLAEQVMPIDITHLDNCAHIMLELFRKMRLVHYIIGGCPRDLLLNKFLKKGLSINDIDFLVMDISYEDLHATLSLELELTQQGTVLYIQGSHPHLRIIFNRGPAVDINVCPSEGDQYSALLRYLQGADLTLNALALHPYGLIIDFFGGIKHAEHCKLLTLPLKTIEQSFEEDPIRCLRLFKLFFKLKKSNGPKSNANLHYAENYIVELHQKLKGNDNNAIHLKKRFYTLFIQYFIHEDILTRHRDWLDYRLYYIIYGNHPQDHLAHQINISCQIIAKIIPHCPQHLRIYLEGLLIFGFTLHHVQYDTTTHLLLKQLQDLHNLAIPSQHREILMPLLFSLFGYAQGLVQNKHPKPKAAPITEWLYHASIFTIHLINNLIQTPELVGAPLLNAPQILAGLFNTEDTNISDPPYRLLNTY